MTSKHAKHFEAVIERCDERIANVDRAIERFCKELKENPHHAFQWADSRMEDAAHRYVAEVVKSLAVDAIERGREPRDLNRQVRDAALQAGKFTKRSTSQGSNLIDNATTAAWIQAMDGFDGLLRNVD